MSDPELTEEIAREDFAWALDRVTRLCVSALVDAQVYRQKLLKGFGYPNETFRAAQDYRALRMVLDERRAARAELLRLRAERDRLREALADVTAMCQSATVWLTEDFQGLRYHALEAAKRGRAALTPTEDR